MFAVRKNYRKFLWCFLCVSIALTCWYTKYAVEKALPDRIKLIEQEEQNLNLNLPVQASIYQESTEASTEGESNIPDGAVTVDLQQPCTLKTGTTGCYKMNCKLFGIFDLKEVTLEIVEGQKVIPCGDPIGIYMETNGVLVIGSGKVKGADGTEEEPARGIVQSGDYIVAVNGEEVEDKEGLQEAVKEVMDTDIVLKLRRNGEIIEVKTPVIVDPIGERKLGIWVRDNIQGIGTLTYVTLDGEFGALGHGISDIDTGTLMELAEGALYDTQIIDVVKGKAGEPGELTGVIRYSDELERGDIEVNSECGIYGTANNTLISQLQYEPIEVGLKQNIEVGSALVRCSVDGEVKDYDAYIERVELNSDAVNKGIVIRITDEELLEKTGGIVQGMSGSPIIQNNKLVGAVTHVFVQDSTRGYGIFVENMLGQN